jgi:hypothetical protein
MNVLWRKIETPQVNYVAYHFLVFGGKKTFTHVYEICLISIIFWKTVVHNHSPTPTTTIENEANLLWLIQCLIPPHLVILLPHLVILHDVFLIPVIHVHKLSHLIPVIHIHKLSRHLPIAWRKLMHKNISFQDFYIVWPSLHSCNSATCTHQILPKSI